MQVFDLQEYRPGPVLKRIWENFQEQEEAGDLLAPIAKRYANGMRVLLIFLTSMRGEAALLPQPFPRPGCWRRWHGSLAAQDHQGAAPGASASVGSYATRHRKRPLPQLRMGQHLPARLDQCGAACNLGESVQLCCYH